MMLTHFHGRLLRSAWLSLLLLSLGAIWPLGCSGKDAQADSDVVPADNQATSRRASMRAIEANLTSADNIIVESHDRKTLSPELRQRLMDLVMASTVKPHGIRPGNPVGDIPAPPMPPPSLILWVVDRTAYPTRDDAVVVLEIYAASGPPFVQIYQPGKEGAFLLENDGWQALLTAIENERKPRRERN